MAVLVEMIKTEFRRFQMQQKCVFGHTLELLPLGRSEASKRLNAIDVRACKTNSSYP